MNEIDQCIFIKFPSIDNVSVIHDDEQLINNIADVDCNCDWVVTEKIDGSNFQLIVTRDCVEYAKRSAIFDKDDKTEALTNFAENVDKLNWITHQLQRWLREDPYHNNTYQINLYGEYFGTGINNRVFYGEKNYFRWFALAIVPKNYKTVVDQYGNEFIEPIWKDFNFLQTTLHCLGCGDQLVPVLGRYKTFEQALNHTNDFVSVLTDDQHASKSEGVVITPYYLPFEFTDGQTDKHFKLIFKNKSETFRENQHRPKYATLEYTSEVEQLKNAFVNYCTLNRMIGLFSKIGNPTKANQISMYIAKFIDDCVEDFVKDYPSYNDQDKKSQKYICSIGNVGFELVKQAAKQVGLGGLFTKK